MVISTRRLDLLPEIDELRQLCQSLAMLDAIIMPRWDSRYYSFNARWGEETMLASMRNGSGDDYFILFTPTGAVIKSFDHESPFAESIAETGQLWSGVLDQVPADFALALADPALTPEWMTFCIWRHTHDPVWQIGAVTFPTDPDPYYGDAPDGSAQLLAILDGDPRTYHSWAQEYYEDDTGALRVIPLPLVEHIYRHQPLSREIIAELNPMTTLTQLRVEIAEFGYPA